jgi:hypothetical protein
MEGLAMEDVAIFIGILSVFCQMIYFSTFLGHLVHFIPFWSLVPRKNLATLLERSLPRSQKVVFFLRCDRSLLHNPGPNPTKHGFPNFTHICKIFSQMCVKFLTNL